MNMDKLQQYIQEITIHAAQCNAGVTLSGEKREGLASIIHSHCQGYEYEIELETLRKVKEPRNYQQWECNMAEVWSQMTTGGGNT